MKYLFGLSALLMFPLAYGRDCSAPPVRNSDQAVCYATAYADKNGLAHGSSFKRKVAKGKTTWNVHFEDTRAETRGAGWEAEVDMATGTVTRFKSYKGDSKNR
ncbi:MAG: hypothetical protein JO292_07580 [Betaproteobacteria bacterium]|nr:hypothetical protein [Betaproteobacteria bacterium]MBV9361237.1 hypothetical protein [Betaproteobacteria bacterium]